MSAPVTIVDRKRGFTARVDMAGAIATGPARPSLSFNATLGTDNTPVTIVHGKADSVFCITGIILTGNKNIAGATDAVVSIYTAATPASATKSITLLDIPVAKSAQTIITGILLETGVAEFIVGTTTDDDVLVTILGFYI